MTQVDPGPETATDRARPALPPDRAGLLSPDTRTVSLGGGRLVPYPEPVDVAASKIAKANRRRDTKPEVRFRSALHRRALRFRKDHLLRIGDLKVRPDVVFSRWRLAVFVDGCFWHGCPEHQRVPQRNREYWVPKLQANIDRDRRVDAALAEGGWDVVRVWEHEEVEVGAERVVAALERRHRASPSVSSCPPDRHTVAR